MPDLITHLAVAYLVQKPVKLVGYTTSFYIGTILPDIITRPFYIIWPGLHAFLVPLHTPLPLMLFCLLLSYFFDEKMRKGVFVTLLVGSYLHLFLDLFQRHLNPSENYLFFPFSSKSVEIGLFWTEDSLYAIPFLLAMIILIEVISFSSEKVRN